MSIKKIFDSYDEFQTILKLINNNYEITENQDVIQVSIKENFNYETLSQLKEIAKNFEVYCNPSSSDLIDIIDDIKRGSLDISEITSVSIILEKEKVFEEKGNLDYFFFVREESLNNLNSLKKRGKEKINIGIPDIQDIETDTIIFHSLTPSLVLDDLPKKQIDSIVSKNIDFYLSNNKNINQSYYNNPYAFIIKNNDYKIDGFSKIIQQQFYLSILECLSDKKSSDYFILRGEKTVTIEIEDGFLTENYNAFINIFEFLISEKKYTEKYIIIKKVFSIYVHDKETIENLDLKIGDIWKTINHYYDHYVEDNIKDFFKTKDQLLKEAMNVSKVVYEQTDKVNNSIITSVISVIILIVTTIYRSLSSISATYYLVIIFVFILFSALYFLIMNDSSRNRYKLTKSQFLYFTKEISILRESEIEDLRNTYLEEPYKELKFSLLKFLLILIAINLLLIISFLIFLCATYNYCLC